VKSWGYVSGSSSRSPTVDQIKAAIYQYGPVAVTVTANMAMQGYSGGIFNGCTSMGTNHMVVLVGWDDKTQSWILRNSWGADWGEDGYMRIRYNCSRVGEEASYVVPEPMTPASRR
jgi:C1A family cysteine protease